MVTALSNVFTEVGVRDLGRTHLPDGYDGISPLCGMAKPNVDPLPGSDSTQMCPP